MQEFSISVNKVFVPKAYIIWYSTEILASGGRKKVLELNPISTG